MPHERGNGRGTPFSGGARRGRGRSPLRCLLPSENYLVVRHQSAPPPRRHRALHALRGEGPGVGGALPRLQHAQALHGLQQEAAGVQARFGEVQGLHRERVSVMGLRQSASGVTKARERREGGGSSESKGAAGERERWRKQAFVAVSDSAPRLHGQRRLRSRTTLSRRLDPLSVGRLWIEWSVRGSTATWNVSMLAPNPSYCRRAYVLVPFCASFGPHLRGGNGKENERGREGWMPHDCEDRQGE